VTIAQHKQDVSFVLDSILDRYKEQSMVVQLPVLVGHSVGGMIVMKMLEDKSIRNKISGNLAIHSARVSLASPRWCWCSLCARLLARSLAWLPGAVLLCSVPPSGNAQMIRRFLRRDLVKALCVSYGIVLKAVCRDAKVCRDIFFDKTVSEKDLSL
jgi:hypothetical protein